MKEEQLTSMLFAHEILITNLMVIALHNSGMDEDKLATALLGNVDFVLNKRRDEGLSEEIIKLTHEKAEAILSSASISAQEISK